MHLHLFETKTTHDGTGVIYTMASGFIHPDSISKDSISRPVSAAPMGAVDVTANDGVYSNSEPSRAEIHALHRHAKQTAHALGVGYKKMRRVEMHS
ncbi:hypothetical protein LPJ61_002919 [Coemansia biformis]|uniref:Uncharacterized protein n=1 Tax=Coemansia biformis TaxID=1286918 RepID=A0A9W7YD37_9FUNG|nr:hypothetical protein LPJ61_002919 [Coemansia biformis]